MNKEGIENLYTKNHFTSTMSGELVMSSTSTYLAQTEPGTFMSYTFDGTSWTINDKKGTVYLFGSATSSRMDDANDTSRVFKWMLSEVRDTNDNFIRYTYYKNAGQIYPASIFYTGHGSADGNLEVDFLLESRNDHPKQYNSATTVTTNYRINEIRTLANGTWVHKYALGYATGDVGARSLLSTITESGQDEVGSIVTLPAQSATYQSSTNTWTLDTSMSWPQYDDCATSGTSTSPLYFADGSGASMARQVVDINGDSRPDILVGYAGVTCEDKWAVINNGDGTWTQDMAWSLPYPLGDYAGGDTWGVRLAEMNGDGLIDAIYSFSQGATWYQGVYINNGHGWTQDTNYVFAPVYFLNANKPNGARVMDVNGDGLSDIVKFDPEGSGAWINKGDGTGWVSDSAWIPNIPTGTGSGTDIYGTQWSDYNGDGLIDFLYIRYDYHGVFINNGHGWTEDTGYASLPTYYTGTNQGFPTGVVPMDLNGDGFGDLMWSSDGYGVQYTNICLNKGDGTGWSCDTTTPIPLYFARLVDGRNESGTNVGDFNGDGLPDLIYGGISFGPYTYGLYTKNGKAADILTRLTYPQGGKTDVSYKGATQYRNGSTPLNTKLPFELQVVNKTVNDDGFGTTSTTWNTYEGGKSWYGNPHDHRFAGFSKITNADTASNTQVTYFHQGDASATGTGEYLDHVSKIGRPYRIEYVDSSSNTKTVTINKWDKTDNTTSTSSYVKLARQTTLDYDGNGTHKDKSTEYFYDAYGNASSTVEWGEVTASNDGTFSDVGSDKRTTDTTYVSNPSLYVYGLPLNEQLKDQSAVKKTEKRYYYDTLALGSVGKGNMTKEEVWRTSTSYYNIQKVYNTYGLVTRDTDPRAKNTDYLYDTYLLYPSKTTQPLGLVTWRLFDYSSGKVKQTSNPNLLITQTVFDGLDRPLEEKQPDQSTSSTLVTKATYAYTDTSLANAVKKTDWLDGSNGVDTWTYLDGFSRPIQTRREDEASNTFAVSDVAYDTRDLVLKEALPYFSTGPARTAATGDSTLYTNYSYDALKRPSSVADAIGTTSYAYDDWKTTATDPKSNVKKLYKDAFGRLNKVEEINNGSTYTTTYTYNAVGDLTNITDAAAAVRNFTYDGLHRRLTAQDVHASADGSYGTWTSVYDAGGNQITRTTPGAQTISSTFDDLSRLLTEDFTGASGTEETRSYDSCQFGKGYLCSFSSATSTVARLYGPTGQVVRETKTISGSPYQTDTTYDRQGNVLMMLFPDGSQLQNSYNAGGRLNRVQRKESGGSWTDVVSNFDYGPHGKPTLTSYANSATTTTSYDATKRYRPSTRVTTAPLAGGGSKRVQDVTYTYDADSNITRIVDASETDTARTTDYAYDGLNRLMGATTTAAIGGGAQNFVYGPTGNITYRSDVGTYIYPGTAGYTNSQAVISASGVGYIYDRNGDMTASGSNTTLFWNYKQQLLHSVVSGTTTSYAYDGEGERVRMTSSATATNYASDWYSVSSGTSTKHVFANGAMIATVVGSGSSTKVYYVHTDHLTGTDAVTSATGSLIEASDYYPYGTTRVDTKTSNYSEVRKFAGQEKDDATGFSFMGARYYHPSLGRFTAQDPVFVSIGANDGNIFAEGQDLTKLLSDPQQLNSYAYARNNPLSYVDPNGKASTLAWLTNPVRTAAQVFLWGFGSSVLDMQHSRNGGAGMGTSAAFVQHSVSLNPGSLSITGQNQKDYGNVVDKIVGSSEYQSMANRFIQDAESKGVTTANSSMFKDLGSSIEFNSNTDLFASIHKADISFQGSKNSDGSWNVNANVSDTYNFAPGSYNNPFFGTANNAAVVSQSTGAVSNYHVDIQVKDNRKKSP